MTAVRRRVLLDECLPHDLRHTIIGHDVETARFAVVAELTNGLLINAIEGKFDVLVTMDSSLHYQQNLVGRKLAVIVLRAKSDRMVDLLPLVPLINIAGGSVSPGQLDLVS
jgi:hypothetical protein